MSPYQLCRTAEGFLRADRDAAQALLEEAFTAQEQTGQYWVHAELLRLRGELRAVEHKAEQAEQSFAGLSPQPGARVPDGSNCEPQPARPPLARTRPRPSGS